MERVCKWLWPLIGAYNLIYRQIIQRIDKEGQLFYTCKNTLHKSLSLCPTSPHHTFPNCKINMLFFFLTTFYLAFIMWELLKTWKIASILVSIMKKAQRWCHCYLFLRLSRVFSICQNTRECFGFFFCFFFCFTTGNSSLVPWKMHPWCKLKQARWYITERWYSSLWVSHSF